MGLDITFFKTKRENFKDREVGIYDENGDNIYGDKEIYYFRGNYKMRDYLRNLSEKDINGMIIKLNIPLIQELSLYLPEYSNENDKLYFLDKLTSQFNKNYTVYVECNW